MDLMALEEEPSPQAGQELVIRVLGQLGETCKVVATTVEPLHRTYLRDGQVRTALPSGAGVLPYAGSSTKGSIGTKGINLSVPCPRCALSRHLDAILDMVASKSGLRLVH